MTATTLDLRRELREVCPATPSPALVEGPDLPFHMVDGHGDPGVVRQGT